MSYIIGIVIVLISVATMYGAYDMLKQINKIKDVEN